MDLPACTQYPSTSVHTIIKAQRVLAAALAQPLPPLLHLDNNDMTMQCWWSLFASPL